MALKLILVEVERLLSRVPWHLPTMFVLPGTTQAHRQGVCGQGTHCRSSDQWMVTSDRKPDSQNTASFLWIPSKDLVESCWIIGNCNELTCMTKSLTTQSNLILMDVVLSQAVLVPLQLSALTLLVLLHGLQGMALWAFPCFLLVALWPNVYASCSDEECDDTAWLQVYASEPEESAELPEALEELADCDTGDMGCVARKTACSLATKMATDWPVSYSNISEILGQLQDVCNGKPLELTSDTSGEALEVEDDNDDDDEEMKVSHVSLLSDGDECSDPGECTTNVIEYEKENPEQSMEWKQARLRQRLQ